MTQEELYDYFYQILERGEGKEAVDFFRLKLKYAKQNNELLFLRDSLLIYKDKPMNYEIREIFSVLVGEVEHEMGNNSYENPFKKMFENKKEPSNSEQDKKTFIAKKYFYDDDLFYDFEDDWDNEEDVFSEGLDDDYIDTDNYHQEITISVSFFRGKKDLIDAKTEKFFISLKNDKCPFLRVNTGVWDLFVELFGQERLITSGAFLRDENGVLSSRIIELFDILTEQENEVLCHLYGLKDGSPKKTLEEAGEKMSLSKERIRQIQCKALRKLRHPIHLLRLRKFIYMQDVEGCVDSNAYIVKEPYIYIKITTSTMLKILNRNILTYKDIIEKSKAIHDKKGELNSIMKIIEDSKKLIF